MYRFRLYFVVTYREKFVELRIFLMKSPQDAFHGDKKNIHRNYRQIVV